MAVIRDTVFCGFNRDGVIRAEEHFNGPCSAAEVDLEALNIGEYGWMVSKQKITRI